MALSHEERIFIENRCLEIWQTKGENYRTLLDRYHKLVEKRRAAKIKLNKLPQQVVKDYPDVPFLKILSEEAARDALADLGGSALRLLLTQLNNLEFDYAYCSLRERVSEWEYWDHTRGAHRSEFGVDPDYGTSGAQVRTRKNLYDDDR